VDKSLVLVDQPPTGTRYRVLETVRQYAHDRLVEAGEAEAAHDRHCEWCLQLAERAKPELIGPRQAFWLDRLEMERNNIRAALAWAVERGPAEMALRLAAPLWRFYLIRDQPSEGWDWLTRVLAASAEHVPTSRRAEVLEGAAALASWLGNHADVQRMAEESLAINRALGDHRGSAVALGHLAVCAVIRADFDRMEEFAVEALAEARKSGDSNAIGRAFLIHGANAWYRGNLLVARYRFEECMGIWRGTGDRRGLQGVLVFLGMVTCQEGDYIAARTYLEEALAIGRELCSNARIGEALVGLGDLARLHGDDGKARALVTEGLGLLREAGNRERIATALFHLGAVARREGHPAEAERLVHECLAIFAETRARPMVQVALSICGVLAILRGAPRRGAQLLGAGSLKGGHFRLLLPDDLQAYEESQAAAQIALGEEWFTTAYCAGQAMTLEHAVAYALEKQGNGADGWAITKEPLV
jgi:tetratricopeptide (TPR) repeat protein